MKVTVVIADPAGNRTAIVRQGVPKNERAKVADAIMRDKDLDVEQVGFETRPLYGGSNGRLEMAGGEFCGNAARSFGYLLCTESGKDYCKIEMSGTREILEVICDPERGTSATQMPMPEKMEMVGEDAEHLYPLVVFRGIAHMLCIGVEPDPDFAERIIDKFGGGYSAFGIQFLQREEGEAGDGSDTVRTLTPVVHVAGTDTTIWERSCGSGSLAMGWYETQDKEDGFHTFVYREPGGDIIVNMAKRMGRYAGTVGGKLSLEEPRTLEID